MTEETVKTTRFWRGGSWRRPFGLTVLGLVAVTAMATATARSVAPYEPDANAARASVPSVFHWDLTALWSNDAAWEKALSETNAGLARLADCKGHLGESAQRLSECLNTIAETQKTIGRLDVYASTNFSTDRQVESAKARLDRVRLLETAFGSAVAFVDPEMLQLDEAKVRGFVAADKGLAVFAHRLDDLLRRKAHILSPEAEETLALSGDLQNGPYAMLNALQQDLEFPTITDEDGEQVQLAFANFSKYRASQKRAVRKEAVEKFFGTLAGKQRSFAASLDMGVKRDIFVAKARKYGSALEASLDDDNVPVAVFEQLLDTTAKNLPRTLHRYVALRKKALKLDEVHYYDLYTSLVPSAQRDVTYPEAVALISAALQPLGDEYLKVLRQGMDLSNGWVDLYPNKGKRSGAYQTDAYGVHPYVFLNYMNELDDAFTTAHEFGHAMHSHLANGTQAYPNAQPPIFLAEIASTFNEELLLHHLLADAKDPDVKRSLLAKRLENIRQTVFRQIMFAEFERDIHAEVEGGGALTAERTNEIYEHLVRKYYGPDFTVDGKDGVEWAYVPHFYYNFYVYKYATGLMSSIALAGKVLAGEAGAVERYLDLLSAGGSDYPLELLKRAGVDLTGPEAMQATFDLFAETLDEFERLL